jgi:sigma-B regulation protein RsbU (phosphoserine phosphatase)
VPPPPPPGVPSLAAGTTAAFLQLLVRRAPIGIGLLDTQLRFVLINERLAEINGVPAADHVGRTPADIVPDVADAAMATLRAVLETGEPVTDLELRGITPAHPGEEREWLSSYFRVEDDDGTVLGVGATVDDVTERSRAQRQLRLAFEERDQLARTLQAALLPPDPPRIDGVDLAVRYLAAGDGNEVGGDFYDAFELLPGVWQVVVGDVCGKGPEAAAVTTVVRHTLRASALHHDDPSEALRHCNEAILRDHTDRFATVATLTMDQREVGIAPTLVLAGHPPPILVRDGSAAEVGDLGQLLGVFPEVRLAPTRLDVRPGDLLCLFTDGVTDQAGHRIDTDELERFLAEHADGDVEALADELTAWLGDNAVEQTDDIAVILMRWR